MSDSSFVEVYSAADVIEAHFLKNLLADAGIEAHVVGESLSDAAGGVPLGEMTAPRVSVAPADVERARRLVKDWEQNHGRTVRDAGDGSWQCPDCGELVRPNFSICWNCGVDGSRNNRLSSEDMQSDTAAMDLFNPRVLFLCTVITLIAFVACRIVGASPMQLLVIVLLSNLFSMWVGWSINRIMPPRDHRGDEESVSHG